MVYVSSGHGPYQCVHNVMSAGVSNELLAAVIWTKSNPTPWNTIKPDETTKMLSVNQKFEKRYVHPLRR